MALHWGKNIKHTHAHTQLCLRAETAEHPLLARRGTKGFSDSLCNHRPLIFAMVLLDHFLPRDCVLSAIFYSFVLFFRPILGQQAHFVSPEMKAENDAISSSLFLLLALSVIIFFLISHNDFLLVL